MEAQAGNPLANSERVEAGFQLAAALRSASAGMTKNLKRRRFENRSDVALPGAVIKFKQSVSLC